MSIKSDYIQLFITREQAEEAERSLSRIRFDARRGLHRFGSERERTVFGQIGQILVADYLGVDRRLYDINPDFDLIFNGLRLEVKTISCKFIPPHHYLATVNSCDLSGVRKQQADYYVFTRVQQDQSVGWLVGCIPCPFFWTIGEFKPVGSEVAGCRFEKANATVVPISALYPLSLLQERAVSMIFPGSSRVFRCCAASQ